MWYQDYLNSYMIIIVNLLTKLVLNRTINDKTQIKKL